MHFFVVATSDFPFFLKECSFFKSAWCSGVWTNLCLGLIKGKLIEFSLKKVPVEYRNE